MSNADKMFEELGYEKTVHENIIVFSRDWEQNGFEERTSFSFYLDNRMFSADESYESKNITLDEYKAITEQLLELGW